MSLIKRNITRVAKDSTDLTMYTDSPSTDAVALALTTSQKLYLAFKKPFTTRYFHFSALNTNAATLTVKYWNGSAFAAVEDLVDQTRGFTQNGFISWQNVAGWQPRAAAPWADMELYWVEITTSANLHADTALQAVLNLFVDEALLKRHYPELVTDTRWLPDNATNFLEQYVAASDMVITRLKQDKVILDESQIIDINEVALAAVHFAAFVIYWPVTRNEAEDKRAYMAESRGNRELNGIRLDLDQNHDGIIEESEKESGNYFRAR